MRTQKLAGKPYISQRQASTACTNVNGLRLVEFAAGRQVAIKNTYFMHKRIHHQTWHSPDGHTFNQIDHCSTEDTFLTLLCRTSNTKPQQLRRFAVDRRKDRDVASRYYDEVESELQGVQVQPLSLDEKC
jgi:hypothetical protein